MRKTVDTHQDHAAVLPRFGPSGIDGKQRQGQEKEDPVSQHCCHGRLLRILNSNGASSWPPKKGDRHRRLDFQFRGKNECTAEPVPFLGLPHLPFEFLLTFALRMSEADQRKAGRAAKQAELEFIFNATINSPRRSGMKIFAPAVHAGFSPKPIPILPPSSNKYSRERVYSGSPFMCSIISGTSPGRAASRFR